MKMWTVLLLIFTSINAYCSLDIDSLTDKQTLTITILLEARGESKYNGMESVAQVIFNRSLKNNKSIKQICLSPKQFSCWNTQYDATFINQLLLSNEGLHAWYISDQILSGTIVDKRVTTSLHYYANTINTPKWAEGKPKIKIGNQFFLINEI